ncbi:MAG TPA: hypothetical protein VFE51_27760 [Verrucomicrobiae bacterium]|nr:hypothetical protein [Verrucomicrobiae bacterium]
MNPHFSNKYQSPSSPIVQELKPLVAEILRKEGRLYIELVDAGLQVTVDALPDAPQLTLKQYSRLLVEQGLPAPRASEIKAILTDPAVAREFVRNELTVKEALAKARGTAPPASLDRSTPQSAAHPIIAALERLLKIKSTNSPWQIDMEEYVISFEPLTPADQEAN